MPVRPAPVLLMLFGPVVFFNVLKTSRMFDCISERPINIPDFLAGIIVAFPMLGATTGAFPMPEAFIVGVPVVGAFIVAFDMGTFRVIGIPIVVFGIMVISFGKGLISDMPLSPVIGIIVGLTVAAIVMIPTAATNDTSTSRIIATFNILISIPPQYPLCRTTHQLSYTVINIIII
jgi:hypothetical protein